MVPKLSKAEVRDVLLRLSTNGLTHGQNFYNCIAKADADFTFQYGSDATLLNRAKADVRNSKILFYVKQLMFEDPTSYQYVEDKNSFYVRVEGCVHVRFKKLDDNGRSSPSKTKRDTLYRMQDSGCLPFLDQVLIAANLDVGYTLAPTGLVSAISFSCCAPLNLGTHWRLRTQDLGIKEAQQNMFEVTEEEVIPILQLDVKEHLKKRDDERKTNDAV